MEMVLVPQLQTLLHPPLFFRWEGQGELVQSQAVLKYTELITQTASYDSARSGKRSPTSSTFTPCTPEVHPFPPSPSRETRCGVPVRPQTLSSSVFSRALVSFFNATQ